MYTAAQYFDYSENNLCKPSTYNVAYNVFFRIQHYNLIQYFLIRLLNVLNLLYWF